MPYCAPNSEGTGGELNPRIDTTKSIFDDYKTAKYHKLADFAIGEVFRKHASTLGWTPANLTNDNDLRKLMAGVRDYLKNGLIDSENDETTQPLGDMSKEAYEDIADTLIPNFEQFVGHYLRYSPIIHNAQSIVQDGIPEDENTVNDTSEGESEFGDQSEVDDLINTKYTDRPGNDISAIEMAAKNVKLIFRLIPKAVWNKDTNSVELYKDADGLPTTADFGPVFNKLLVILGGTRNYEAMLAKLSNIDTLRVVPEAQYLAEILKVNKNNTDRTLAEFTLLNEFYQQFSKPKVQLQSGIMTEKGDFNTFDEITGNLNGIKEQFTSNFQTANVNENVRRFLKIDELFGYSIFKPEGENINIKDHLPIKPKSYVDKIDFLSLLGIKLTGLDFLDTETKRDEFDKMLDETVNFLYNSVLARVQGGQVLRDPINDLRDKYVTELGKTIRSEKKSLDRLTEFESKYSSVTPSLSTRTANGELAYLISLDNQLTIVTYHLNNSNTIDELMDTAPFRTAKYNPLFRKSFDIQFLFDENGNKRVDENGNKRTIDLANLSGYKQYADGRANSKLERELSTKAKFIQDLNMMWVNKKTDVMRPETSHSFFTKSLLNYDTTVRGYFAINGFIKDFKSNNGFKKVMFDYLTGEITRVKSYTKKKEENPTLPSTYGEFSLFYEVLEQNDTTLRDEILAAGKLEIDSPLFARFLSLLDNQLVREVQNVKDRMTSLGIDKDELVSENAKKLINGDLELGEELADEDFDSLLRNFIANTFVQNIEFTILYAIDPLYSMQYFKRLKGVASTGDLAAVHSLFSEYRNSRYEQTFHKKYSVAGAIGRAYRNNDKSFQTKTLKEYKQSPDFAYMQDQIVEDIQESLTKRDGVNTVFTEKYIREQVLKNRDDQKPADGQGYISLDAHREFSLRFGVHTPELEIAYKYEGLIYRRDIANKELTEAEAKELSDLQKTIYSNPNKYAIPVWKVTYWGSVENATVDTRAWDKLSLAPLLPSDVRSKGNEKLSKLLTDLVSKQISYVKYESGTKLFSTTPVDMESIVTISPDEYSTELLKMQIKAKSQQNDSTAIPTQLLKLIFSNLFDGGKPVNDTVAALYKSYIGTLKNIQRLQGGNLLEELGISEEGVDMRKLSERLISQAKKQELNSNTINALRVEGKNLVGALEESGFVKQVVDLVAGLADTRLRRWEMPGGDFVLVSNANRSKLNFYKYDETGTMAADIRITLNGEFIKLLNKKHPDGEAIGSIERLNALLDDAKWRKNNEKLLTVVMGRVPIQGPNSMEFGVVREFLTPTMGNVVILPEEAVFKSGLDFDYDKQKVLTPSLTEDGAYIENVATVQQQLSDVRKAWEGVTTDFYNKGIPTNEKMQAIRDAVTKVREIVIGGQFDKLLLKVRDTDKRVEELRSLFADIVNLEIAKQSFEDTLKIIDTYKDYETPVEKFPTVPDARAEGYLTTEIESVRDEINTITDAFYTKLNELGRKIVQERIGDIYGFKDRILSLIRMEGRDLEENYNKIIETYKDVLSLPEMFAELVTPNSTKTVSPVADAMGIKTGNSVALPVRNKTLNYLDNLNVRDIFFSAKIMMGPFAVDNTYMEMMQYLGIDINNQYFKKWGKGFIQRTIQHHLLDSYEVKKIKSGDKIRTSLRDDIDNYVKQHFDSEAINFTIDSAKDPRFALLNIGWQNVGVVNLMKLMGYPFPRVVDFINQPVLLKYVELVKNGFSKNDALVQVGKMVGIRKTVTKQEMLTEQAYLQKKKDPTIKFSKEEKTDTGMYKVTMTESSSPSHWDVRAILRAIDNKTKLPKDYAHLAAKIKNDNLIPQLEEKIKSPIVSDSFNLRILAHFVAMDEHNTVFRNLHHYFNNDKVKVSTPTDIKNKDNLRETLFQQVLFSSEDLHKMENDSVVAPFMNNNLLKAVFKSLLPVIGREDVQDALDVLYREYSINFYSRNKRDLRNMPKVLTNDFITATVFNFSMQDGKTFLERNKHLIIKEKGKRTIAQRLDALKKQPFYAKLARQFPVLEQFVISSHIISEAKDVNEIPQWTIIRNIKLVKPFSETSIEEEGIIDQLRTLQKHKIKDRKYSKEERATYTTALQGFMTDLFNLGILQSGFTKTYIGFSEYIPQEYIRSLFAPALKELEALSPAEFSNFLARFQSQFRYNNPKYFPKVRIDDSKGSVPNNNDYSARFKLYDRNLDYDVDAVDDEEDPTQDSPDDGATPPPTTPPSTTPKAGGTSSEIYSKLGNKTKTGNVTIKPWSELKDVTKAITKDSVISTRVKGTVYHFGNPFTSDKRLLNAGVRLIETKSTRDSVEKYINWVLTGQTGVTVFDNTLPDFDDLEVQRNWILEQLKSGDLKGKQILYYKELGEPSHATALDYLINKYNWQTTEEAPSFANITEITRDKKKEKFSYLDSQKGRVEIEGYRVHMKEYPDFKGFVYKTESGRWSFTEENTGLGVGVFEKSAKEAISMTITKMNNAMKNKEFHKKLMSIGIKPTNKPGIEAEQKCK